MPTILANELELTKKYNTICGVDEAGRGPLAGPVVCSAVIFDLAKLVSSTNEEVAYLIANLNDSKKLSEKKREKLFPLIKKYAKEFSIIAVEPIEIDKLNILHATLVGMDRALDALAEKWELALIDGNKLPPQHKDKSQYIIKGDATYFSIAAASVLAKVTRDKIMTDLHLQYPHYNWLKNKGYPTKEHVQVIAEYGITPYHRLSFAPCTEQKIPGLINN